MLCYFQGFHDIVQVFLLVLGPIQAIHAVAHLCLLRIRDFMLPSISASLTHLQLLPPILRKADPELYKHLSHIQPHFALAATLTLHAHEIHEYGDIARLFDFLLAHEATVSIYFFAVIVISRRDELFNIPADEPDMLHSVLSKMPKSFDLERLITQTMTVFSKHPPKSLSSKQKPRISRYSVLETTKTRMEGQSLAEGVTLFDKQVAQLRRQDQRQRLVAWMWKHRRPVGRAGVTFGLVLLAWWVQRSGWSSSMFFQLRRTGDIWRHKVRL